MKRIIKAMGVLSDPTVKVIKHYNPTIEYAQFVKIIQSAQSVHNQKAADGALSSVLDDFNHDIKHIPEFMTKDDVVKYYAKYRKYSDRFDVGQNSSVRDALIEAGI